jgi:glycosyltransferase involved in cell wall biosynthesis
VASVTIKLGVLALAGPDNGGTYQYTLSMLQALKHTSAFEITVYGDPANRDFLELGYPLLPFAETRAQQLIALTAHKMKLRSADRFAREDVLLAPIYSPALLHTTKPFAYTLHDLQENYYPGNFTRWQRIWRHQVHAALLARASRVICESGYVKNDIVGSFDVPEARIAVITAPPLRQAVVDQTAEQLRATRERLQLPARFLFYPAQFWVHKNHLRLIEAFAVALTQMPDLKLVLTGKKRDEYETVMAAVARLGLGDRVIHLGYVAQEDLQTIYQLATALVMPSLFESVSIPIYEAFQAGTPVAASGILAMPEQVGDAGVLFDPMSVASISQAILQIAGDAEAARLMGQRGKQRMRAMTSERYGAQLQDMVLGMR